MLRVAFRLGEEQEHSFLLPVAIVKQSDIELSAVEHLVDSIRHLDFLHL